MVVCPPISLAMFDSFANESLIVSVGFRKLNENNTCLVPKSPGAIAPLSVNESLPMKLLEMLMLADVETTLWNGWTLGLVVFALGVAGKWKLATAAAPLKPGV